MSKKYYITLVNEYNKHTFTFNPSTIYCSLQDGTGKDDFTLDWRDGHILFFKDLTNCIIEAKFYGKYGKIRNLLKDAIGINTDQYELEIEIVDEFYGG